MSAMRKRLGALEAKGSPRALHCPQPKDDHAAKAAALAGRNVTIVRFPGLNDGAVEAFQAALKEVRS